MRHSQLLKTQSVSTFAMQKPMHIDTKMVIQNKIESAFRCIIIQKKRNRTIYCLYVGNVLNVAKETAEIIRLNVNIVSQKINPMSVKNCWWMDIAEMKYVVKIYGRKLTVILN